MSSGTPGYSAQCGSVETAQTHGADLLQVCCPRVKQQLTRLLGIETSRAKIKQVAILSAKAVTLHGKTSPEFGAGNRACYSRSTAFALPGRCELRPGQGLLPCLSPFRMLFTYFPARKPKAWLSAGDRIAWDTNTSGGRSRTPYRCGRPRPESHRHSSHRQL